MNRAKARPEDAFGLSAKQIEEIRLQLAKILSHALFIDTTRMKRFLTYVVEEMIAGRGARLKGYSIGLEVFDKPSDFDPQSDTIVRVQAGQLRRRLDLYYASDGENDPVRLTIPKGRYAPRFEFREPGAVTFEPSNDVVSDGMSDRDYPSRPGLAVVTFEDHSGGDQAGFFAKGLTAEIISALVQFRHIRIVAQHPNVAPDQLATSLPMIDLKRDVQYVLSGNVRKSADVLRVVVSLAASDTGQMLYRETFDRAYSPDTLFELQESIGSHVAAAIAAPFGLINRHNRRLYKGRRQSVPAYEAVLRFYEMGLAPQQDKARRLLTDIEAITASAPDFSSGFAIQSMLNSFMCTQCIPPGDPTVYLSAARGLAQKAMSIDPMNSMAYFAAFQALHHSGEIEAGLEMAQKAMALNPNDYAMLAYFATTRALMGDVETAHAYDQSARHLVVNPPAWFNVARLAILFRQGEYDRVLRAMTEVGENSPVSMTVMKTASMGMTGQIDEGRAILQSLELHMPDYTEHALNLLSFWHVDEVINDSIMGGWSRLGVNVETISKSSD